MGHLETYAMGIALCLAPGQEAPNELSHRKWGLLSPLIGLGGFSVSSGQRDLITLQNQPDLIKASCQQIFLFDIEIDPSAITEHEAKIVMFHRIKLEQQTPPV